jgi:hypothetical protein
MNEVEITEDRKILNELILRSKDDIRNILEYFESAVDIDKEMAYKETMDDLFVVMIKIIKRALRFVEYRSKVKIVQRGEKISQKELDRCDFILKINSKNSVSILKNKITGIVGRFDSVQTIAE